jgi:hypothetical protein
LRRDTLVVSVYLQVVRVDLLRPVEADVAVFAFVFFNEIVWDVTVEVFQLFTGNSPLAAL